MSDPGTTRHVKFPQKAGQMPKTPQVGEPAPDFELPGTDRPFKLSEHLGERVVLLFYPGDETMLCTKQFCSYRDRGGDFASLKATVVGISSQDLASHEQSSPSTA
jgi:peroxiredoxin Q/BCP